MGWRIEMKSQREAAERTFGVKLITSAGELDTATKEDLSWFVAQVKGEASWAKRPWLTMSGAGGEGSGGERLPINSMGGGGNGGAGGVGRSSG